MPSLTTDDGRTLAWRETGTGPPLLCHPGGPGCSGHYFGDLPELGAQRTLLLLDPRGTGGSDRPTEPSAYDLGDYAADVEAVRAHLGLQRLDVLGHSHGGFVAMAWAGAHPDRVGRLVLTGTAPRFTDAIRARRQERLVSHRGQPYFTDAIAALQAQQAGRYASDDELLRLYERASRVFARVGEDLAPTVAAFRAGGLNADAMSHFNEHVAPAMDRRPQLRGIGAPTLVIAGEHDAFGAPATMDELAGALPHPTVVTVPGTDHFPFLEPQHRGAWSRPVLDFLAA
ncbi:MAG: alpha/beta hydrolase [Actinomycetota bacterium]|nr:alpha/beta hydrolase [Actinomycetota bacterium]